MFFDFYKNKKVIITGDTGFKGSWLAIWLNELGAKVFGYSLPPNSGNDNFQICHLDEKIKHSDNDIRDLESLLKYFDELQPDIAFHLAAQPIVLESLKHPKSTYETNLMGTVNFFEAIRNTSSVKAGINVTSDKCYENKEWLWGYRESDPIGGKDPYSASKGGAEVITNSYIQSFFNAENTANIASARSGNVIGAGDWAVDRIVPDYFRAMKNESKLMIRNSQSIRPWQHVLEPLSGYLDLGEKLYCGGAKFQGAWNFGPHDTTTLTVSDLVNKLDEFNEKSGFVEFLEGTRTVEAIRLKLDTSKALSLLGWRPTWDIDDTVKYTIQGYQSDLLGKPALENRISTIHAYTTSAQDRKIAWSTN